MVKNLRRSAGNSFATYVKRKRHLNIIVIAGYVFTDGFRPLFNVCKYKYIYSWR